MGVQSIVLAVAVVLSVAGAALIPFTTWYPYFVTATFGSEECVVANVGAVTSSWTPQCAGDALPQLNFTVPTKEFWPLFPVHNPTAAGNPLAAVYEGAGHGNFTNCTHSVSVAVGAINYQVSQAPEALKEIIPPADLPTTLATLDFASKTYLGGDLEGTNITPEQAATNVQLFLTGLSGQLKDFPPALFPEPVQAKVAQLLGLVGQCYCNTVAADSDFSYTVGSAGNSTLTVPVANLCPPTVVADRIALYGSFGKKPDSAPESVPSDMLDCFAQQATYQGGKNVAKAFNTANGTLEALIEECENDNEDIAAITLAALMLTVGTGAGAVAFLTGAAAAVTKNTAVVAVAGILSLAASGITVFALLTVRGAPIYASVGKEGCAVCYGNSTSFFTGLGAIALPAAAGLLFLGAVFCGGGDDEESEALVNKLDEEP